MQGESRVKTFVMLHNFLPSPGERSVKTNSYKNDDLTNEIRSKLSDHSKQYSSCNEKQIKMGSVLI